MVEAERGLSPADLAMHVVLPEVDGRIYAGVASFKTPSVKDPDLQYSRFVHRADSMRVNAIVKRIKGWYQLREKQNSEKHIALILSTYPGKIYNLAHAVGLDALASADAILTDLSTQGYDVEKVDDLAKKLKVEKIKWPLEQYISSLREIPQGLRKNLNMAWGDPIDDPFNSRWECSF